jgi:hypothetical protein
MSIHPFPPVPSRKPDQPEKVARRYRGVLDDLVALKADFPAPPDQAADEGPRLSRAQCRRQVIHAVKVAIRCYADEDEAEELYDEFQDELEDMELEDDAFDRPVDEIVVEICDVLGVPFRRKAASPSLSPEEAFAELERLVARFRAEWP